MGLGLALTGFGRFHGIESNPSASVLDAVAEDPVSSVLCVAKEVLETSASGSSERLKEIVQTLAAEQQISAVLLVRKTLSAL